MKHLFLTLILSVCFWAQAISINQYKVGDKLTVLAKSGLVLRANPKSEGKKKNTLTFGTEVTVLTEGFKANRHTVDDFKGYTITGFWVKVKAGSEEGWVFDGYLSKLKIYTDGDVKGASADFDMFDIAYLYNSPRKGERKNVSKDNRESYEQAYEDGSKLTVSRYEGGSQRVLLLKEGISQEEALLWGRALWFSDAKYSSQKYNRNTKHVRILGTDDNTQSMRVIPNGKRWEIHFDRAD